MANTVEIYTKWGCGYCVRAKKLLDGKGIDYTEYDITMGGDDAARLRERAPDARTVPQIFIADRAIGGSDELVALEETGELDRLF